MRISPLACALVLALGGSTAFAIDPVVPCSTATPDATPAPAATIPLKFADLPAAVVKVYNARTEIADPISIEKSTQDGKTIYTIRFNGKKDGKTHTIKIGEDGRFLKKCDDKSHGRK